MFRRRLLALSGLLVLSGCLYHAREHADRTVCNLAARPFDLAPPPPGEPARLMPPAEARPGTLPAPAISGPGALPAADLHTTLLMQAGQQPAPGPGGRPKIDLNIPPEIPGSEAPRIVLPLDPAAKRREVQRIYTELPPLPAEPTPQPGPEGQPYTLAALQQLAGAHSPQLRQAAADVEAARGNLIQARAYPNPTVGYEVDPSNDGSTAGVQGFFVDQPVKTGGKLRLQAAAAESDLRNAELALRRARSDLATQVRNAYYAVLVAHETMRVNRALAHFTDEIYRLQAGLLAGGFAAPYEPAALRALAYTARLAYQQSIQAYIYAWKQLVAAVGLRQLPLSDVAGRIDAVIPYFDYDTVRAHVLNNHTDVLAARNVIDKARYNLKLAQVTPVPDLDVRFAVLKEYSLPPKQGVHTLQVGMPFPIWDQNKGAIIAAESALVRATEEPHRVEESLTTTLATNYVMYRSNLEALEYYRRYILPDQVRYYRGVFDRRQIDPAAQFGDLVTAQQTLATNVTSYLTILGQLWTSVVSVADLLQTDDLFQLGQPLAVPELPELDQLPSLPCCHLCPPGGGCPPAVVGGAVQLLKPATEPAPTGLKPPEAPAQGEGSYGTPMRLLRLPEGPPPAAASLPSISYWLTLPPMSGGRPGEGESSGSIPAARTFGTNPAR